MINHRLISSDTIDDLLNSVYRIIQEKGSEVPASRGKKQIIKEITGRDFFDLLQFVFLEHCFDVFDFFHDVMVFIR